MVWMVTFSKSDENNTKLGRDLQRLNDSMLDDSVLYYSMLDDSIMYFSMLDYCSLNDRILDDSILDDVISDNITFASIACILV